MDTAWHLTLPVITLTLAYLADYSLIMRSSLLDELGEDYLVTARAKGLRDVDVRRKHAVPQRAAADHHLVALNIGFVVGGRDHHRDDLLDPGPRPAGERGARRSPTTGCCRAPSWWPRPP